MNTIAVYNNKWKNRVRTFILLLSMSSIMLLIGWMIAGNTGMFLAVAVSVVLMVVNPYFTSNHYLKTIKAQEIPRHLYPQIYKLTTNIANNAGLPHTPRLYCVPSKVMNAFVIGKEEQAAIVMTDSLLRHLNLQELAGIIGHEIAHIRNNDLWVMSVASISVRTVHMFSMLGQIALLFALPAIMLGQMYISTLPLLLLVFSPTISVLLQLALSRTREFEADLTGSELVGSPYGLVSALHKLEQYHRGLFKRYMMLPWQLNSPSLLQTHPPTKERIDRLMSISNTTRQNPSLYRPFAQIIPYDTMSKYYSGLRTRSTYHL